ncbi:MAG: CDGSH iron-sulfur domain-containing protein [Pelovirga sp.]
MSRSEDDQAMPIAITLEPGTYFRCTCGASESLPFCDGHHQAGEKVPIRFTITERERVYLCACWKTDNPPHCDGSCGVTLP